MRRGAFALWVRDIPFSISAGVISDGPQRLRVQPVGELTDLQELRDLVVGTGNVRLGDIADVRLKPARMDYGRRLDGQPAVGLDNFKERNANLVEVSSKALAEGQFELRPTEVRCNGYDDVTLPERRRWRAGH